jgi:hypothetical protein
MYRQRHLPAKISHIPQKIRIFSERVIAIASKAIHYWNICDLLEAEDPSTTVEPVLIPFRSKLHPVLYVEWFGDDAGNVLLVATDRKFQVWDVQWRKEVYAGSTEDEGKLESFVALRCYRDCILASTTTKEVKVWDIKAKLQALNAPRSASAQTAVGQESTQSEQTTEDCLTFSSKQDHLVFALHMDFFRMICGDAEGGLTQIKRNTKDVTMKAQAKAAVITDETQPLPLRTLKARDPDDKAMSPVVLKKKEKSLESIENPQSISNTNADEVLEASAPRQTLPIDRAKRMEQLRGFGSRRLLGAGKLEESLANRITHIATFFRFIVSGHKSGSVAIWDSKVRDSVRPLTQYSCASGIIHDIVVDKASELIIVCTENARNHLPEIVVWAPDWESLSKASDTEPGATLLTSDSINRPSSPTNPASPSSPTMFPTSPPSLVTPFSFATSPPPNSSSKFFASPRRIDFSSGAEDSRTRMLSRSHEDGGAKSRVKKGMTDATEKRVENALYGKVNPHTTPRAATNAGQRTIVDPPTASAAMSSTKPTGLGSATSSAWDWKFRRPMGPGPSDAGGSGARVRIGHRRVTSVDEVGGSSYGEHDDSTNSNSEIFELEQEVTSRPIRKPLPPVPTRSNASSTQSPQPDQPGPSSTQSPPYSPTGASMLWSNGVDGSNTNSRASPQSPQPTSPALQSAWTTDPIAIPARKSLEREQATLIDVEHGSDSDDKGDGPVANPEDHHLVSSSDQAMAESIDLPSESPRKRERSSSRSYPPRRGQDGSPVPLPPPLTSPPSRPNRPLRRPGMGP